MASNSVFVDTSWFKATVDGKDKFYQDASSQLEKIVDREMSLITTNFIIDESLTLIRIKSTLEVALEFRQRLFDMASILKIVRILRLDEKMAWKWFPKNWSKLSFTDCTSFAVMKRLGLTDVATFDQHFAQAGFKIFK